MNQLKRNKKKPLKVAQLGMTIIEILVVMAIVAMMAGLGVTLLNRNSAADMRNDLGRLATAIQYTYANAALTNSRFRLVIDIDKNLYYTEIEEAGLTQAANEEVSEEFLTQEAIDLGEKKDRETDLFDADEDPFGLNRKISFKRVEDSLLKDTKLTGDITFAEVQTTYRKEPFYDGKAFVTFYPGGFQDAVLIYLTDAEGNRAALVTESMTGRVMIYTDVDQIPDGFGEVETDDVWAD